jgi:hypothetical protein
MKRYRNFEISFFVPLPNTSQITMSGRWSKTFDVNYMAWGRFRDYVLQSSSDDLIAAELLLFDLIWGGADLMLDLT